MNKGILYISCGVPGSGKTTFLKKYAKKDESIISRDEIRFALLKEGEDYFSHEKDVFKHFVNIIAEHINSGLNVYADATHLNQASRYKLLYALKNTGCHPSDIQIIFFDIPLDVCLERNEKRKNTKAYVPRSVIRKMFYQLEYPVDFSTIWIVDKDGNISKSKEVNL